MMAGMVLICTMRHTNQNTIPCHFPDTFQEFRWYHAHIEPDNISARGSQRDEKTFPANHVSYHANLDAVGYIGDNIIKRSHDVAHAGRSNNTRAETKRFSSCGHALENRQTIFYIYRQTSSYALCYFK